MPCSVACHLTAVKLPVSFSSLLNELEQQVVPGFLAAPAGYLILGSEAALGFVHQQVFAQTSVVFWVEECLISIQRSLLQGENCPPDAPGIINIIVC